MPAALRPTAPVPRRLRLAAAMLAALSATALAPARGAEAGRGVIVPAPVLPVGPGDGVFARKIDLGIGKSVIVDLPRDAKEVFVANPKVANAVVRSTRKIFLIGMGDGHTSVFVMDAEGRQIASLEISIGRDLNVLRQTIKTAMPKADINVISVGDNIVLTGSVDSAAEAAKAQDIANAFVGITTHGGTASSSGGGTTISFGGDTIRGTVINSLVIRGRDQVMLKVTVAEVQRSILKQLGVNTFGSWEIGKLALAASSRNPFGVSNEIFPFNSVSAKVGGGRNNFQLIALERAGVMRMLAEPTLTAISGESAKFVAGGEIQVPTQESCEPATGVCRRTLTYKPIGVSLNFTPVVLSEGRISVRVATEVTDFNIEHPMTGETVNMLGFRVRKMETTVELPSGGTLVSAGLIQQSSRQVINGFPGLMNLPVLGSLFRSRDYQRSESELLILVTPYIAKPSSQGQLARPDDGFADSTDPQAILLGRLNRLYGVAGSPAVPTAYKGRAGFITD